MIKKYANYAFIYAILAMIFGVFYREFTKFNSFNGRTTLSFMHTHYFVLGMIFFLILMSLEKNFAFSNEKIKKYILFYQIGLNITALAFIMRGIAQVLNMSLSKALDASISGIAGIGHIIISVCILILLNNIKKSL